MLKYSIIFIVSVINFTENISNGDPVSLNVICSIPIVTECHCIHYSYSMAPHRWNDCIRVVKNVWLNIYIHITCMQTFTLTVNKQWQVLPHPTHVNKKWGKPYFPKKTKTTKPQNQNRPPLFLSSYTTKLDQIQYATLFQPY